MASVSNLFNPGPERYPVLPAADGSAWLDVDRNGKIDDSDAFLRRSDDQPVEFETLRKAMEGRSGRVPAAEAAGAETSVVNGTMCFDAVSSYRQKQSFQQDGAQLFYHLEPDPNAPVEKSDGTGREGTIQLVEDADGVLRWVLPGDGQPAPEPAPSEPNAVSEPTCIERDGILHWLFPGDKLEPGDKVIGNPDNFIENLSKR